MYSHVCITDDHTACCMAVLTSNVCGVLEWINKCVCSRCSSLQLLPRERAVVLIPVMCVSSVKSLISMEIILYSRCPNYLQCRNNVHVTCSIVHLIHCTTWLYM